MSQAGTILYPLDASWQCPRAVVTRRSEPVQAADPPATPKTPFNPTWISAGAALLSVACVLYTLSSSPFKAIDDKLGKINDRLAAIDLSVAALRKDTDVLQKWVRLRDPSFPGGSTAPPAPSASSSVPIPSASAPDPTASTKGLKGFPSSVAPTSPPECVSSKTFHKMPCEQAAKDSCRGLNSFTPDRYREIRTKAGVGEYMLVCAEKSP